MSATAPTAGAASAPNSAPSTGDAPAQDPPARNKRRNDGNQRGGRSKRGKQGALDLGDLRADIESLRRSVAFKSDVDQVLDRLQELTQKLEWLMHSVHAMHGMFEQQAMAATTGYGAAGY